MSSEPKVESNSLEPVKVPPKKDCPLLPVLLRDLPLPPEVEPDVADYCRKYRLLKAKDRQWVEEEYKLMYYFGGNYVVYLPTPDGRQVLIAGDFMSQEFAGQQERLSREVRRKTIVTGIPGWNSDESWI